MQLFSADDTIFFKKTKKHFFTWKHEKNPKISFIFCSNVSLLDFYIIACEITNVLIKILKNADATSNIIWLHGLLVSSKIYENPWTQKQTIWPKSFFVALFMGFWISLIQYFFHFESLIMILWSQTLVTSQFRKFI